MVKFCKDIIWIIWFKIYFCTWKYHKYHAEFIQCHVATYLAPCYLSADLYLKLDRLQEAQECISEASAIFPVSYMVSYMVRLCSIELKWVQLFLFSLAFEKGCQTLKWRWIHGSCFGITLSSPCYDWSSNAWKNPYARDQTAIVFLILLFFSREGDFMNKSQSFMKQKPATKMQSPLTLHM